jgi:hypothetical protein
LDECVIEVNRACKAMYLLLLSIVLCDDNTLAFTLPLMLGGAHLDAVLKPVGK